MYFYVLIQETQEIFGASVAIGVKSGTHQSFTEALQTIIIPAYEKANSELFKQLYETFNKGTVACMYFYKPYAFSKVYLTSSQIQYILLTDANQLSSYTKMYEPIHNELVQLMRSVPEQLKQLTDSTVSTCTQKVSSEINKDLKAIQANLLKSIKDNLKNEVSRYVIATTIIITSHRTIWFKTEN